MQAFGNLINAVINIFIFILIVQVIMSWLIAFIRDLLFEYVIYA